MKSNKLVDNIIDVTGGKGGNAFLVMGNEKTALVDCGMAYCASNLIRNIKQILNQRPLNYILISHSHYDHIGAIPYLRKEWPNLKVLGAAYAKQILNKENALETIRNLSMQAATFYDAACIEEYDDQMLKVDHCISDGDVLDLGDVRIKVIETRGHTKCSLSFLVNNEILFLSESTGYMSKSGTFYPAFLTSCSEAVNSIKICEEINPRFIISPHFGLVSQSDTLNYWKNCILAINQTREFIIHLFQLGYKEDEMLIEYENIFRDEESRLEQPSHAFRLNAQNMIKVILSEK